MAKETLDFNKTPSANRIHISFFGKRNAGKSSVVNAVTGQNLAIVSDIKGTTTDPVTKAMELLPLGPVVITDTPGVDDTGVVGEMRVDKTYQVLRKTDLAVLVVDNFVGIRQEDKALIETFREKKIPFLVVLNKVDLDMEALIAHHDDPKYDFPWIKVSALSGEGIEKLKEKIASLAAPLMEKAEAKKLIRDKIGPKDVVILVTPIDDSAPKGRMILPQVQTIRDILDGHGICMVCQLEELESCLAALKEPPALVITDSQVFGPVKKLLPEEVMLTSFSILFARFKRILDIAVTGARFVSQLKEGDSVLISEGCTHHRQCEDIGTVKLPGWIENFAGCKLHFEFTSGGQFPTEKELAKYAMVVHCGGCMLNEKEMIHRMDFATKCKVPFTNYGTLIAHMNGILNRSLEIFE